MLILDLRRNSTRINTYNYENATTGKGVTTMTQPVYIRYNGSTQASTEGDAIRIIGDGDGTNSVVYQPSSHTFGDGRLIVDGFIVVDFYNLEPVSHSYERNVEFPFILSQT
jgi:hypothetical protein